MKKTFLPLALGCILALASCGGTSTSSDSHSSSSEETSSSSSESSTSSSSEGSTSSSEGSSTSSEGSTSSSEPVSGDLVIDLTGESDDFASRPGTGLQGTFSFLEIIGSEIYFLSATSSRSVDSGLCLMEEGAVLTNDSDLVNISSISLAYELNGEASLALGSSKADYVTFPLDGTSALEITAGTDFGAGYPSFRLRVNGGSLTLKSVRIAFSKESQTYNTGLSYSLKATSADIGTRAGALVGDVYLTKNDNTSSLLKEGYEVVGTLNGAKVGADYVFTKDNVGLLELSVSYLVLTSYSYEVYVYDFEDIPSASSVLPSVSSLHLYEGESYSFSYDILPASYDPSLVTTRSTNPSILEVEGTRVSGLSAGTAQIVIAAGATEATISVEVTSESKVAVSPISYTATSYSDSFAPSLGEQKVLIVPIKLSGTASYVWNADELSTIASNIFGADNPNSLVNYYDRASNGRIRLSGEVYGDLVHMYESSYSESQLNDYNRGDERMYEMLEDCVAWLADQDDLDLDSYDSDDDGHIDSIHFIVNGSDKNSNYSSIWPHMGTLAMEAGSQAAPTIMSYSLSNLGHLSDALTTIHEQGHIYGLEDYYDYSYVYDLLGGFDMQDIGYGDWNSYSKMSLGWVDPLYADLRGGEEVSVELKPASLGGSPLVVATSWNGSAFDEYILIELFTKDGNNAIGWDEYEWNAGKDLGEGGIRLYHVDARLGRFLPLSNGYYSAVDYVDSLPDGPSDTYVYLPGNNNTLYDQEYASPSVSTKNYGGYQISKYHLLHLIQAGGTNTFGKINGSQSGYYLSERDLFATGDSFSLSSYSSFFENGTTFNDGSSFPYTISFDEVGRETATVTISRA